MNPIPLLAWVGSDFVKEMGLSWATMEVITSLNSFVRGRPVPFIALHTCTSPSRRQSTSWWLVFFELREEWQLEECHTLWQCTKGLFILEFLDIGSLCGFITLLRVVRADIRQGLQVILCFLFFSKVLSFVTGLSSLLGPLGFWQLVLPVGVCSLDCNNNNSNNRFLSNKKR